MVKIKTNPHKIFTEIRIKSSLDAILSSAKSTASRISSTASTTSSSILSNHPNLNVDLLKHLTYNTLVILSTFLISFTLISLISTRYNSGTMQPSPEPEQSKAKIQKVRTSRNICFYVFTRWFTWWFSVASLPRYYSPCSFSPQQS